MSQSIVKRPDDIADIFWPFGASVLCGVVHKSKNMEAV